MEVSREEQAWAAGLFEGEGSISSAGRKPRLALKMISEQSVRRFGDAVQLGKVYGPYGPYPSQIGRSPIWMWVAEGWKATEVADVLRPWLSEAWIDRIDQIERCEKPRRLR